MSEKKGGREEDGTGGIERVDKRREQRDVE